MCLSAELQGINAFQNLDDYGVHTAPAKFLTVLATNLTSILAFKFLNGWQVGRLLNSRVSGTPKCTNFRTEPKTG